MNDNSKLTGSIDNIIFSQGEIIIHGWWLRENGPVLQNPVVMINGKKCPVSIERVSRNDLSKAFGDHALTSGFKIRLGAYKIYNRKGIDIAVYPDGFESQTLEIHRLCWLNKSNNPFEHPLNFYKTIQNPVTRIKDPQTVAYAAVLSIIHYRSNTVFQSVALCVLWWRIILDKIPFPKIERITSITNRVLRRLKANIKNDGPEFRWYVSLSNAFGFAMLELKRTPDALQIFSQIAEITDRIENTWIGVPNGITARFIIAYLKYLQGSVDIEAFNRVKDYLDIHLGHFNGVNYWAYDELLEVTRTAQQAVLITKIVSGKLNEVNPGADFEPTKISAQMLKRAFAEGVLPVISLRKEQA